MFERSLSAAAARGVATFFDAHGDGPQWCDGSACHFARLEIGNLRGEGHAVRCFGHCHDAPVARSGADVIGRTRAPSRVSSLTTPIVFRHLLAGRDGAADHATLPEGDAILAAITRAGLRGRGGAAYPTAAKWRVARDTPAKDRWVVANGDEGDPGAWVDRLLLEHTPHAILAGMRCCARVIGASQGIVYIRHEYPAAQAAMRAAIADGAFDDFSVRVVGGHGSYVCGEESALLRAIAGRRAEPHPKPPYPAESGLDGLPTIVQNIETLSIVPWIASTGQGAETKVVCVSGAVGRPGAVEVAFGTSIREVLAHVGGCPPGKAWKMALIGGPMGRVIPACDFDVRIGYNTLPGLGHAGMVLLDDTVSARAVYDHYVEFGIAESCGNCTPCRVGTSLLARYRGRSEAERIFETMEMGSLCGFGTGVSQPLRDLWTHFGGELC